LRSSVIDLALIATVFATLVFGVMLLFGSVTITQIGIAIIAGATWFFVSLVFRARGRGRS